MNGLCEGLGYVCQSNQLPPSLVHRLAEPCYAQIFMFLLLLLICKPIHQIAHTDPTKPFTIELHLLGLSQCNYYRSLGFRDQLLQTLILLKKMLFDCTLLSTCCDYLIAVSIASISHHEQTPHLPDHYLLWIATS